MVIYYYLFHMVTKIMLVRIKMHNTKEETYYDKQMHQCHMFSLKKRWKSERSQEN